MPPPTSFLAPPGSSFFAGADLPPPLHPLLGAAAGAAGAGAGPGFPTAAAGAAPAGAARTCWLLEFPKMSFWMNPGFFSGRPALIGDWPKKLQHSSQDKRQYQQ